MRLGIQIVGPDSAAAADAIIEAEGVGFEAAWLTSGWLSADPFPILSAAARQTSKVLLGTSIIPMLSRHPLAAAQGFNLRSTGIADSPGRCLGLTAAACHHYLGR